MAAKKSAANIQVASAPGPMVIALDDIHVGDKITLTAKVTNDGDVDLEGGTLTFDKGTVQAGEGYSESGSKATIEKLEHGKDVTITAEYTTVDGDKSGLNIKANFECGETKAEAETGATTVTEAV